MFNEIYKKIALEICKEPGFTYQYVAERLKISIKTLYLWRKKYKNIKSNKDINLEDIKKIDEQYKRKNYNKILNDDIKEYISEKIKNNPTFNSNKFIVELNKKFNINIHRNTLYKWLEKLNITFKRSKIKVVKDDEKTKQLSKNLASKIHILKEKDIISLDECSFSLGMFNQYGWNDKGKDVIFESKIQKSENLTLLCTVSNKKVIAYQIIEKSVDTHKFIDFFKDNLDKFKGKHILMDNASFHRSKDFTNYAKENKLNIIYNVPYRPEWNPIEGAFSKVKKIVRENTTFEKDELKKVIEKSLKSLTSNNLKNFFKNSFELLKECLLMH